MKTIVIQPHKSSFGIDANLVVLVTLIAMGIVLWVPFIWYFAWIIPIIVFFTEKSSKFVKFEAIQAFVIGVIQVIIGIILQFINWNGANVINQIVTIVFALIIIFLAIMGFLNKQVELPVIAPIATAINKNLDK